MLAAIAVWAFCGFYVAGSNQQLFNDATQVVLMRKGTRTVLSMQNNYKGPPEAFAMVVPVPVVLHEGDVKTLTKDVFMHVEGMGAPRLVEYWEQDPCAVGYGTIGLGTGTGQGYGVGAGRGGMHSREDLGVTVEAKFVVGEYQIVILSAKDSTGLDTWLRQEKYNIPEGAEPLLRPYVAGGMKFFVAKVDPTKVRFQGDHAVLSPLRFHYDSEEFSLPIRLGLANSSGTQDLIVNILAPQQRYEVANYPNVTIPTNLDVKPAVKDSFAAFYAALFDATLEQHKGAIVTEYAWSARTCDPCPGPTLNSRDFSMLGADVLDGGSDKPTAYNRYDFVLTRLHARYGKDLQQDLVFKQADPIAGGREHLEAGGKLEEGAVAAPMNNFQGRYAIRHPWTGPITCKDPHRGMWGGPPPEVTTQPGFQTMGTKSALDLASVPRGTVQLASLVVGDVPELAVHANVFWQVQNGQGQAHANSTATAGSAAPQVPAPTRTFEPKKNTGCGCQATDRGGVLWLGALAVAGLARRRRRR